MTRERERGAVDLWLGRMLLALLPTLAGVLTLGMFEPTRPIGVAFAWGVAAALVAFRLVRWLEHGARRRRWWRRLLVVHVLVSAGFGLVRSGVRSPEAGSAGDVTRVAWEDFAPLRAGVAEARFELPERVPLAGWGQAPRRVGHPAFFGLGRLGWWDHRAAARRAERGVPGKRYFRSVPSGEHDLGARALVLRGGEADPPVALVRLDLVTSDDALAREVVARLAPLGFRSETVLLSSTHTHSGPGGYSRAPASAVAGTGLFDRRVFEAVVAAAVRSVERAHASARPRRLELVRLDVRDAGGVPLVQRNRRTNRPEDVPSSAPALVVRRPASDEDPHVGGAGGAGGGGGAIEAVWLNLAVHPVVRRAESLTLDRDLAGALEEALAEALEPDAARAPLVLFTNGAAGDLSPASDVGLGAEADLLAADGPVRRLARRFAAQLAAPRSSPNELGGAELRVRAVRARVDFGSPFYVEALGPRGGLAPVARRAPLRFRLDSALGDLLLLPANAALWAIGLHELRLLASLRAEGGDGRSPALGVVACLKHVAPERHDVGGLLLELRSRAGAVPERVSLLWSGAEWTQALAAALPDAGAALVLAGYTNGSMSYATTSEEYGAGAYEGRSTLYGPETGPRSLAAMERVLAAFEMKGR